MHCKGHQKRKDEVTKGNRLADQAAKSAARKPQDNYGLQAPLGRPHREIKPHYFPAEIEWAASRVYTFQPSGWLQSGWQTPVARLQSMESP